MLSAFAAADFFGDRQPLSRELAPMQFGSRAHGFQRLPRCFRSLARGRPPLDPSPSLCIGCIIRTACRATDDEIVELSLLRVQQHHAAVATHVIHGVRAGDQEHRGLSTTRYGRRFNSPDAGEAAASSIDRSSQIFPSKIRMTTMIKMVPRTPTPPRSRRSGH